MKNGTELLSNLYRLHTTQLGSERIRKNLGLDTDDVVGWCRCKIADPDCRIFKRGKNWYAETDGCVITVNASGYTIITARKL